MKHIKLFFLVILSLFLLPAFSQTIAVTEPTAINLGNDAGWILPFIQSVISTNFKKYSNLTVLDLQNINTVINEQKRSERASYSDEGSDLSGQLKNANLTVTGNIVKKASAYALSFNITDIKTGESKSSASIPNCLFSALENGQAANLISYDLMKGAGIALSSEAEKELTVAQAILSSEITAQISKAKGITAEASGSNIEALTYYIQAQKNNVKGVDVSARIAAMSTVISNGNFGSEAKNLIKMRDEWDKLLFEAASLIAQNQISFTLVYENKIIPREDTMDEEDYINRTMGFSVPTPELLQEVNPENEKMVNELLNALSQIPQSKNWGAKINGFPWSYADDFSGNNYLKKASNKVTEKLTFSFSLVNPETNKVLRTRDISFNVKYSPKLQEAEIQCLHTDKKGVQYPYIGFIGVSVDDADTQLLTIRVENKNKQAVSIMPKDVYLADFFKNSSSSLFPIVYTKSKNALNEIKKLKHDATVKITGEMTLDELKAVGEAITNGNYKVELDLSEVTGLYNKKYDWSEIGSDTFGKYNKSCENLIAITVPNDTSKRNFFISSNDFKYCPNLQALNAREECKYFTSQNGLLYSKDSKELKLAPTGIKSAEIAEGTTEIDYFAFYYCKKLESIKIPLSVTSIGLCAFSKCVTLFDIQYAGTKKQWRKIKIDKKNKGNAPLINAAKYCIK